MKKPLNIKKIVLPNLPYAFIAFIATKLGQAWRLAEGADASAKVLGFLTQGLGEAFSSPLPSFHPADLLVGVVVAGIIRLVVYVKGKNAKKFRKNMEYGSARWGTAEDIAPYADPKFENNVILTQTERLMMSNRPKDPKTARNKNVMIIGGSGSGKTRFWLKPNLMQCHSSYVVTDPKGSIAVECGRLMLRNGYKVKIFNSINFKKSMHYNPFAYIHSEKDILKLMKANHQSQQFRLEDNLLKAFPEQIRQNESFIEGFTADLKTLSEHPHPKDGFAGMEVKGDLLTDKDNAGAAILEAFKDAKGMEPVSVGSYRGFAMSLTVEDFGRDFVLTLKGKMNHRVTLGKDARGNLTRIENALNAIPERMQAVQDKLANLREQVETAKAELGKPFPQEEELRTKSARLAELNAELNIDDRTPMEQMAEDAPSAEIAKAKPSVLEKLKAPIPQAHSEAKTKHRETDAR